MFFHLTDFTLILRRRHIPTVDPFVVFLSNESKEWTVKLLLSTVD